jgi:hypothetical protein
MSDEKILDKVKKCLALAASANEHEAAAALRQAQKLMEANGLTDADVLASQASEAGVKAGAAVKPSSWEVGLATRIGTAFGCETIFRAGFGRIWVYIGAGAAPEVASYAFHVLLRQAKKARTDYIDTALRRVQKTAIKTRRADTFCEGWVRSAMSAVTRWTASEDQAAAVQAYIGVKYPSLKRLDSIDRNKGRRMQDHDYKDHDSGRSAGRGAVLNRGVGAGADPLALEG